MKIQKITFKNWRSIVHESVFFEEMMMFVGKNNHGKGNILRAIEFFFSEKNASEKDFFHKSTEISVEITFEKLQKNEQEQWKKYLNEKEELVIEKKQKKGEEAEYLTTPSNSPSPWGEKIGEEEIRNIFSVLLLPSSLKNTNIHIFQELFQYMLQHIAHDEQKIFREKLSLSAQEWGIEMHFEKNGSIENNTLSEIEKNNNGLLRALFFSLFVCFSSFVGNAREHSNAARNCRDRSLLLLWEEPELFLHPQGQTELYQAIKKCVKKGISIFFTTHSSHFVDLTHHKSICIVQRKNEKIGTKVKQVRGNLLSKDERKKFNMAYWINPDRGELFFAKKVILVEGPTEKILLPKLAREMGIMQYETAIIDCAGKTNMPLYITLLNAFRIPHVVVYDLDLHNYRSANSKMEAQRQSDFLQKKVKKGLGKTVAMENDIEDELGIIDKRKRKKPFLAIHHLQENNYRISASFYKKMMEIFG